MANKYPNKIEKPQKCLINICICTTTVTHHTKGHCVSISMCAPSSPNLSVLPRVTVQDSPRESHCTLLKAGKEHHA